MELVDSLAIAKVFGVRNLRLIRIYCELFQIPTSQIQEPTLRLLVQQRHAPMIHRLNDLGMKMEEPIFPFRMQKIPLWENCTNWRVLQATFHSDNESSLHTRDLYCVYQNISLTSLPVIYPLSEDLFRFYENFGQDFASYGSMYELQGFEFVGIVLETVRSSLAKWIGSSAIAPKLKPDFPPDIFEFRASSYLL